MNKDYCSYVSDKPLGVDVSDVCRLHDKDYSEKKKSRVAADRDFRKGIIAIGGFRSYIIGWTYWIGVRLGGWWGY